jgi:predicted nucleic acid-binding protein
MKLFLDANILVSILLKEHNYFLSSAKILSLADKPRYTISVTSVCIAIAYYYAEKNLGRREAKRRIKILCDNLSVIACDEKEVTNALANNKVLDVEDGIEYYAALHADCDCIITNDLKDFYFSDIEVLSADDFLIKYMNNSNYN